MLTFTRAGDGMATDEEVDRLFIKKERKARPPTFSEANPFGRLRKALNISMANMGKLFGISVSMIYAYECNRYIPGYDRILRIYRYASENGIQLDQKLVEEADMAYKDIVLKKKGIYNRRANGEARKVPLRSIDNFDREPVCPIQALRFKMQIKFKDWIDLIDLTYNQALMYERGRSMVPLDLGKRMQEIARRRGIAITLDELYQNVVPSGMSLEELSNQE